MKTLNISEVITKETKIIKIADDRSLHVIRTINVYEKNKKGQYIHKPAVSYTSTEIYCNIDKNEKKETIILGDR